MKIGDYLCEELTDEVKRGSIPIYRALINLRELYATGLITQNQNVECRKWLHEMAKVRADKE